MTGDIIRLIAATVSLALGIALLRLAVSVITASPAQIADARRFHAERRRRAALVRAIREAGK